MDLQQGAAGVVGPAEQELGFEAVEGAGELLETLVDLGDGVGVVLFGYQFGQHVEVVAEFVGGGDGVEPLLQTTCPLMDDLGGFAVVPELGFALLGLEVVELLLQRREVKDPP